LPTILVSLKDPDISIRRRALDLLFALCDQQSAGEVVNELLDYLQENDYELKEEMVLKIAILAEKFA
jgi:AP-2 complex subunit alpha